MHTNPPRCTHVHSMCIFFGEMLEWSNRLVSKTMRRVSWHGGSNPPLAAGKKSRLKLRKVRIVLQTNPPLAAGKKSGLTLHKVLNSSANKSSSRRSISLARVAGFDILFLLSGLKELKYA